MENIECEIIEVNQDDNTILVNINGEEDTFQIISPAKIEYCKVGKATIGMNNEGHVNYCRSAGGFKKVPFKKPYSPKPNYKSGYTGYKEGRQLNQFKTGGDIKPYHFESEVRVFEGITLLEYEKTYNEISKNGWITASQVFSTPIMASKKDEKEKTHILYDAIIYMKVRKQGNRGSNEELDPSDIKEEDYM